MKQFTMFKQCWIRYGLFMITLQLVIMSLLFFINDPGTVINYTISPYDSSLISDLSNMTSSEWIDFKYYKEAQYEQRRVRIKEMCQQINDTKYLKVLNQPNKSSIPIFYNDKHNLTYCQIPKVASTTWRCHFNTLAKQFANNGKKGQGAQQITKAWRLPENVPLQEAMEGMTSFVIVRNPFDRLASAFYEKCVRSIRHYYDKFNASIIKQYRMEPFQKHSTLNITADKPLPTEFLKRIHNDVTNSLVYADPHWRLEVVSCPFCAINFTVIGRLEELNEDIAYIMHKTNIFDLLDINLHANPSDIYVKKTETTQLSKEAIFWSEVSAQLVLDLYQLYKLDFNTFSYDPVQYLSNIGLDEKSQELKLLLDAS